MLYVTRRAQFVTLTRRVRGLPSFGAAQLIPSTDWAMPVAYFHSSADWATTIHCGDKSTGHSSDDIAAGCLLARIVAVLGHEDASTVFTAVESAEIRRGSEGRRPFSPWKPSGAAAAAPGAAWRRQPAYSALPGDLAKTRTTFKMAPRRRRRDRGLRHCRHSIRLSATRGFVTECC